jgi:hypothetical protein
MTDNEKHEFCKKRSGFPALIVPQNLYDDLERDGFDMRWYVPARPIPCETVELANPSEGWLATKRE